MKMLKVKNKSNYPNTPIKPLNNKIEKTHSKMWLELEGTTPK